MNNITMKQITVGFCLSLLAACSPQEDAFENVDTRSVPVELSMRSLTRSSFEVVDDLAEMGVFRTSVGGYEALNNVRYTFHAAGEFVGKWTSDDVSDATKTIYMDHRIGTLFALYPYQTAEVKGTVLTMNGLKRYSEQDNSCLSGATRASNDIVAAFTVKPVYARLSLLLTNGSGEKACIISKVKIASLAEGFKATATLEMSAEHPVADVTHAQPVSSYEFPLAVTDNIKVKGIAPSQTDETIDMLWIPQPLNGIQIEITFCWEGEANSRIARIEVTKEQLAELKKATHHQLRLTIKASH